MKQIGVFVNFFLGTLNASLLRNLWAVNGAKASGKGVTGTS